jgi:hypothetical protein
VELNIHVSGLGATKFWGNWGAMGSHGWVWGVGQGPAFSPTVVTLGVSASILVGEAGGR